MEQTIIPDYVTLVFCNTTAHNPYLQGWSADVHNKLIEQDTGIGLNVEIGAQRVLLSPTEKAGQLPYKGSIYIGDHSARKKNGRFGPNCIRFSKTSFWWFLREYGGTLTSLFKKGEIKLTRVDLKTLIDPALLDLTKASKSIRHWGNSLTI